jgi:hypothetical protein
MNATADPRLRIIRYRGYITACRVLGTLALLPMLFRGELEANGQWNSSVRAVCWSILIATAVIQFWLYRRTRE